MRVGLVVTYLMGLVVTDIKCALISPRFLNQPIRVHLLELGPKSNKAIPQIYHNYLNYLLKIRLRK